MNKKVIFEKLEKLKQNYENSEIPRLHEHEVHPSLDKSSRENYLYFINTCSLNFQRSSPVTWQSALKTWEDPETNFVFFPEIVVSTPTEGLRAALLKHKLALQPNKHIEIWQKIAKTFNTFFENDPRKLFEKCEFDAIRILSILQTEMKASFPYLAGPKLSNYTLFILLHYSNLQLKNTKAISIIPDTHIMKSTVKLGMISEEKMNPINVTNSWNELLVNSEYSPIDFHSMLWNWSRNNFNPMV